MKLNKKSLGKVSLTCNGLWDINKIYERLCLVHNGNFATYLSKKEVPSGVKLSNEEYWQPIAALQGDIVVDYKTFKEHIEKIVDEVYNYVNHLVPEVNWDDVEDLIIDTVNQLVIDGAFISGITRVETKDDLDNEDLLKFGNLVFVNDIGRYFTYYTDEEWHEIPIIHIGNDEPKTNMLWVEPNTDDINSDSDQEITVIKKALKELQTSFTGLSKLTTLGVIPASIHGGYRHIILSEAEPEKPEDAPEDIVESEDIDKPDESWANASVPCVCCKMGEAKDFAKNTSDLVNGEIVFYTDRKRFMVYYQGGFYGDGTSSSGGGSDIDMEQLLSMVYEYLNFDNGKTKYKAEVNTDGNWVVTPYTDKIIDVVKGKNDVYINHLLCINSVYCGKDGGENPACTHNFVELANASDTDINLNGIYLLYTDLSKKNSSDVGFIWKVLSLKGFIKAGSTFLIRGEQVANEKQALIPVKGYDMEWYDGNKLISFQQGGSSFYLVAGEDFKQNIENKTLDNPWKVDGVRIGYIDSCGFGANSVGEGSGTFTITEDWTKLIFVRWFMLEPSKQGNKAYSARKTSALWTYINIDTQTTRLGNSVQYYYSDDIKQMYSPMASYLGKTFFTNKSKFRKDKANYINCLFGIQATDNGHGATRCFNWISVGNYDEFIEIRKVGDTTWNKFYSITPNNAANTDAINKFINHYKRYRWCTSDGTWVTTHKCIIHNLTKGKYEYRIGRDNDINYYSDTLTFNVEANEDVVNFSFIQTSDQQGFNWAEYTAWWKAADVIAEVEKNFNFLINTGDITQSGNRVSEWIDYYSGKQKLIDKSEMFTIGNNDLCGYDSTELTDGEDATSKYNHINVLRYFCFELDSRNDYSVLWNGSERQIYSLYSFNYGEWHFTSLNSEIAKATSKMYVNGTDKSNQGDATFANTANAFIEDWFKKDLQLWKGITTEPNDCSKCIVFMHEMPFTIVTYDFMNGNAERKGSHLNQFDNYGFYRFSRLFKKYGIRLVIGGHKHTYSISKPIYDAPKDYIVNNTINTDSDLLKALGDTDLEIGEISRKPVIQVTKSSDIKENNFARYELVDKINAPIYVMCQATGYKLVSNKEMPSGSAYRIPWLLAYFPAATSASSPKENVAQHKPTYIRYDITPTNIKVTANQIENIWTVDENVGSTSFNMNKQNINLSNTKMTLSTTLEEDKSAYNIETTEYLNITL